MVAAMSTAATALPAALSAPRTAARLWDEAPVFVAGLILFLICFGLMARQDVWFGPESLIPNARVYFVSAVIMLAADFSWRLWRTRPDSPIEHFKATYLAGDRRARLLAGLPMLALLVVFMPFFSKMKAMIPLHNDYTWDATFIAWDRAIFFGNDPWELLQPVFGYPLVTAVMAGFYHLWLLLIYPGCLFFLFYKVDGDVRRRFFLCFILSWTLVGGLLATALASVGPCFLEPLIGNPHFADQMAYLHAANQQVPVLTVPVQEMLLEWFHADERGLGSGITAMPSMHVALCMLYWLAMRELSPLAGRLFLAFMVIICIGSVHLAYHYSVDGLVSIVVVWLLWQASKPLFAWWDRMAAHLRKQPELLTA
jgi:hypothetical protein